MPLVAWLFALTINSVSPQIINFSDDLITISASASGLQSGIAQYLQAAITKEGETTNYLGLTKNLNDEWYQYKSSPTVSDLTTYFYNFTPVSGSWSGQLVAKVDTTDDGFKGPGNYLLKLIKYISSSGSYSNNYVAITINIPIISTVLAETGNTQTSEVSPSIEINVPNPNNCTLGNSFKIFSNLKNFSRETEYYLKLRGGLDGDHLTKMQTKNGESYFSDNESWENFPTIKTDSSGNWSGDVWGLLGEDKEEGAYKIKLRARKKETDTFCESDLKDLRFLKPAVIAVPVATKSSVASAPAVLAAATEISTPEPVITPIISVNKVTQKDDFSLLWILGFGMVFSGGIMVVFLHKEQLWDIIKRRYGKDV